MLLPACIIYVNLLKLIHFSSTRLNVAPANLNNLQLYFKRKKFLINKFYFMEEMVISKTKRKKEEVEYKHYCIFLGESIIRVICPRNL